ncbi:hypothetical protein MR060_03045, partial [bacterium]|nr:hypothetical protein [bacterium]
PLMNMKGGSMLLPHNKVSGGVQDSQIMIPSFFDRFYVMPPLTNGVHYILQQFFSTSMFLELVGKIFLSLSLIFCLSMFMQQNLSQNIPQS